MENIGAFSAWFNAQCKRLWPRSASIWAAPRTTSQEILLDTSDLHHRADYGPSPAMNPGPTAHAEASASPVGPGTEAEANLFIDPQDGDGALVYWRCPECGWR